MALRAAMLTDPIYAEYNLDSGIVTRVIDGLEGAIEGNFSYSMVTADDINLIVWYQRHFGGDLTIDRFDALRILIKEAKETK